MENNSIKSKDIRKPAVAGMFYPESPRILSQEVKEFLEKVPEEKIEGEIIALISPHAGYIYSGQIAACAYKLLEGKEFDSVIVIAPSHRAHFRGASIYHKGGYKTPLGIIPVDVELSKKIINQSDIIGYHAPAHTEEHSLEVQLPFLQTVLKDFNLVPIVMGEQDFHTCEILSQAIAATIKDKKVMIIASSDLSHFHDYDEAVRLDKVVIDHINAFDPEGFARDLTRGACEACGGGPVITAMLVAKKMGGDRGKSLKYANSGDVIGDKNRVVGYLAGVLYKGSKDLKNKNEKGGVDLGLSDQEKRLLHQIVKITIEQKLKNKPVPKFDIPPGSLKEKRGAFVTLHENDRLRGCIGYIHPVKPLHETIQEMAVSAAFSDPRFRPVTKKEFKNLDIEISVLTPLRKISDIREIEVGKHGIYITREYHSGLLLPQVATEYGWDRNTFLEHTCEKAGLYKYDWKDKDIEIFIFSADIF